MVVVACKHERLTILGHNVQYLISIREIVDESRRWIFFRKYYMRANAIFSCTIPRMKGLFVIFIGRDDRYWRRNFVVIEVVISVRFVFC